MLTNWKILKSSIGVFLYDYLIYQSYFFGHSNYLKIRNRNERLATGPKGIGYVCLWPYTSKLHAPLIWPWLGKKLLNICMTKERFISSETNKEYKHVDISVLIGHRGLERLPHLLTTISYIAGQFDVSLECIVIEQDSEIRIKDRLPAWIRYLHQKSDGNYNTYNRSAAFNYGACNARGRILILHDNDMIIPCSYCRDIVEIVDSGYDAVNIKRFVFYLNQEDTMKALKSSSLRERYCPEYIVQNLEAGGSMGITRRAYFELGGMDERFVGWGGEDNEFWDRCKKLRRWIWGFASIIHLWHRSQPLKEINDNTNIKVAQSLIITDLDERIKTLQQINKFDNDCN
ncbi:MAG: glycosyltransferase family 2 protein [Cyanobacteriota bacterium]|jgi:hypothetical protein